MKNFFKNLAAGLLFFCVISVFAADMTANNLPQKIQNFLIANFPEASVNYVKQDFFSYHVVLSNGVTADFSLSGDCTQIDGAGSVLPFTVINPAMSAAVQNNFPNTEILRALQVWKGWQITLNNGTSVFVSEAGQILGYGTGRY